jgi:hypothetical protein
MQISLVLLTLNELTGSEILFDKIPWEEFEEKFVLDAHSHDGTADYYISKGKAVVFQKEKGLGNAVLEAINAGTTEAVVFFHPDGNMDPQDLLKFRPLFDQGNEFIIASRMLEGASNEEDAQFIKYRKWANIVFARIASMLWRKKEAYRVTDPVNGFRGITVDAFNRMEIDASDCSIDYQMLIRAYKKDIRMLEFPTREGHRLGGETAFKSIPTGLRLLKCLIREIFRK